MDHSQLYHSYAKWYHLEILGILFISSLECVNDNVSYILINNTKQKIRRNNNKFASFHFISPTRKHPNIPRIIFGSDIVHLLHYSHRYHIVRSKHLFDHLVHVINSDVTTSIQFSVLEVSLFFLIYAFISYSPALLTMLSNDFTQSKALLLINWQDMGSIFITVYTPTRVVLVFK